MKRDTDRKIILGWREWLSLPELGIPAIKAKVDTGAKTSALHAFSVEPFRENGIAKVRFQVHPLQKQTSTVVTCEAVIADQRKVSDSGGHRENRYVIYTALVVGGVTLQTELTLTDRDTMQFRMLLGRSALKGNFVVDSDASYLTGKISPKIYNKG